VRIREEQTKRRKLQRCLSLNWALIEP
jgi:hypothetical protein